MKQASGWHKHLDFMVLDVVCLHLAYALAYCLRFGWGNPYDGREWRTPIIVMTLFNLRWMKTIDNSHRECAAKRPVSCATRTTKKPERGFRHRSGHFRPAAAAESGAFRRPSEPAPIHRTA